MSCHELNEQNKAGDDEDDDYEEESEEPDYVTEEFCSSRISINQI